MLEKVERLRKRADDRARSLVRSVLLAGRTRDADGRWVPVIDTEPIATVGGPRFF